MAQSTETSYRDWYLRRVSRSFTIATSAPMAEVKEACQRWAGAFGWEQIGPTTGSLTFKPGWLLWTFSGLEMQVSSWEDEGDVDARFVASAYRLLPGHEDDLEEAARRFAEGVDLELREAGFMVTGAWEELQPSRRARLARTERWRRRFTLVASAILIPASLAMWLLTSNGLVGYLTALWIALAILTSADIVRRRLLGMRATFFVFVVAFMWTAVIVFMTPMFVVMALGYL